MKWKIPPRIKVYEALGAIGDRRIEMDGNTAKVYSSSRNKFYTVYYDPVSYSLMVNDNGSYWKGYLGYPAIAYLMLIGKIQYTQEQADALKDFAWKDINTRFKNDFNKTIEYIHNLQTRKEVYIKRLENEVDDILSDISKDLPSILGKKTKPPKEY